MPDEKPTSIKFDATGQEPKPEKKGRGRPLGSKNKSGAGRRPAMAGVKEGLSGYMTMLGMTLTTFPATQRDGIVIVQRGEPFVDSLIELAKTDRRVARALKTLCTGGAYTGVALASASIVLPIMANHNLLPNRLAVMFAIDEQGNNMFDAFESQFTVEPEPAETPLDILQNYTQTMPEEAPTTPSKVKETTTKNTKQSPTFEGPSVGD